jgi:hypothetical protein
MQARQRGDEVLGVLLAGVELYLSLGREYELLESMRKFADEMKEPVEKTPSVEELEELYRREPPPDA